MPAPYDLHNSLGYQTTLFSRISERRFDAALVPLGLTRVSWCILLAVGQEGLKGPSDIADFIGIDRTATSRGLKRLEGAGLITRSDGRTDKRTTEVRITDKGQDHLTKATKAAAENAAHFNNKLSWYERNMLATIIQKLMQNETRDVSGL